MRLIVILVAMSSIATLGSNFYLPGLNRIASEFGGGMNAAKLSLTIYLVGWGLGQFTLGPLADKVGRREVATVGALIGTLSSVGCATSTDHFTFDLFRFLQAFGFAATSVVWRVRVVDEFEGNEVARIISQVGIVTPIVSMLTPMVGGIIVDSFGWRLTFWVLALFGGMLSLVLQFRLRFRENTSDSDLSFINSYAIVILSSEFRQYIIPPMMMVATMYLFLTAAPEVFIVGLGYSATKFGLLLAIFPAVMVFGNFVNSKIVTAYGAHNVARYFVCFAGITSLLMVVAIAFFHQDVISFIALFSFLIFCSGIIMGSSMGAALNGLKRNAGGASAAIGVAFMMGAAIGSSCAASLSNVNLDTLSLLIFLFSGTAIASSFSGDLWSAVKRS